MGVCGRLPYLLFTFLCLLTGGAEPWEGRPVGLISAAQLLVSGPTWCQVTGGGGAGIIGPGNLSVEESSPSSHLPPSTAASKQQKNLLGFDISLSIGLRGLSESLCLHLCILIKCVNCRTLKVTDQHMFTECLLCAGLQ